MVPKIVHYAWFGSEKPLPIIQRIERWKKILPEWEFKEWNESNWDLDEYTFSKEMYQSGNLGYVADPLRFDVLNKFGGVYLDTDMEINKDLQDFLNHKMTIGFMYDNSILTSMIISEPNVPILETILDTYSGNIYKDIHEDMYKMTSNPVVTKILKREYPDFKLNGQEQTLKDDIKVLPLDYFAYPSRNKSRNYAEHMFMNSWGTGNVGLRGTVKHLFKSIAPYSFAKISQKRGIKSAKKDGLILEKKVKIQ